MRPADAILGLYVLVDPTLVSDPLPFASAVLRGGARVLQLRWKHADADALVALGRELGALTRAAGATLVANDDADIALAMGADGLHLGQTDGPIAPARRLLGPNVLIGRSTHEPDQIDEAVREADYLAFGPVYPTPHLSRAKPVRGISRLRAAVDRVAGRRPIVAIGGIDAARLAEVRATGVSSWAVLGALAAAPDPEAAARTLAR